MSPTIFLNWPRRRRDHPERINRPPGLAIGDIVPGRGCTRCFRCHYPWTVVEPFTLWYTLSNGSFMFCEGCWPKTTFLQRVRAYAWLSREHWRTSGNGKVEPPLMICGEADKMIINPEAPERWHQIYYALVHAETER